MTTLLYIYSILMFLHKWEWNYSSYIIVIVCWYVIGTWRTLHGITKIYIRGQINRTNGVNICENPEILSHHHPEWLPKYKWKKELTVWDNVCRVRPPQTISEIYMFGHIKHIDWSIDIMLGDEYFYGFLSTSF